MQCVCVRVRVRVRVRVHVHVHVQGHVPVWPRERHMFHSSFIFHTNTTSLICKIFQLTTN